MNFTIDKCVFLNSLNKIKSVVEKSSTIPILSSVVLDCQAPGTLKVIASDLVVSYIGVIPCVHVEQSGKIAINANSLTAMVKNMPSGDITFDKISDLYVQLSCDKDVKYKVLSVNADEYPEAGILDFDMSCESDAVCNVGIFQSALDRVACSVSVDNARPVLNGSFVRSDNNNLLVTTTDGHKLSHVEIPVEGEFVIRPHILPKKGVVAFGKVFTDSSVDCNVVLEDNNVVFYTDKDVLSVRTIDGVFPDFTAVLPKETTSTVLAKKDDLIASLKRAGVITDKKYPAGTLKVNDEFAINVTNPDIGEMEESVTTLECSGDISVGVNINYVLEGINTIPHDEIRVDFDQDNSPIKIYGDSPDSYFIVMPMRI